MRGKKKGDDKREDQERGLSKEQIEEIVNKRVQEELAKQRMQERLSERRAQWRREQAEKWREEHPRPTYNPFLEAKPRPSSETPEEPTRRSGGYSAGSHWLRHVAFILIVILVVVILALVMHPWQ